jgi:Ca2+-binding RTX toxin-like protein
LSGVADIDFSRTTSSTDADIWITRGANGGARTTVTTSAGPAIGSLSVAAGHLATVSIDTSNPLFGPMYDPAASEAYSIRGGFPYDTIVHELLHAIGLGHGGPYDEGDGLGSVESRQFTPYDNKLWTIMSYIQAGLWGTVTEGSTTYDRVPTTPMVMDIMGLQRLYGAPTDGPFAGGNHIFGFNSNVAGFTGFHVYDFNYNKNPAVTIWATGANNWLDLSGWNTPATIDINPEGQSSANGMVDNITIVYGIQNARGGGGNDTITGNDDANRLEGMGGNDTLDGGLGADTLVGGAGNDVYHLYDLTNGAFDTVNELAGQGTDMVLVMSTGTPTYTMTANVENGAIVGHDTNNVWLIGNNLDNTLYDDIGPNTLKGGAGNDHFIPGAGQDDLYGGTGNDSYELNDRTYDNQDQVFSYDYVTENAGEGSDFVYVTAIHDSDFGQDYYALTANVEGGELLGSINFDLYGNDLDNRLFGNTGANVLTGYGGNDKLIGQVGDDTLYGGGGNDSYYLEDLIPSDGITLAHYDTVIEDANGGSDSVFVTAIDDPGSLSEGYTLGDNIENGVITGSLAFYLEGNDLANQLKGNGANNSLYGDAGNDTLDGGAGADTMEGMAGNDVYVRDHVNDVVDESVAGSSGVDTVQSALTINLTDATHFKGAVENAVLTGAANVNVTGNLFANVLTGNSGANLINGMAGADAMRGMGGNDVYTRDNAGDIVDESLAGSNGFDSVRSSLTINLADAAHFKGAIEAATLTGAANVNLTGSGLNNTLTGNGVGNVINGGAGIDNLRGLGGNDGLVGGTGNDTLAGGNGNDVFLFNSALHNTANVDAITDFSAPNDTIWLDNAVFTALGATGALAASAFHLGAAATDTAHRILYDSSNGWLRYDADGSGASAAIHFATLTTHPAITSADFVVV